MMILATSKFGVEEGYVYVEGWYFSCGFLSIYAAMRAYQNLLLAREILMNQFYSARVE
jgi:hypothetical protein